MYLGARITESQKNWSVCVYVYVCVCVCMCVCVCVFTRLFWYWYFLKTVLTVSNNSLMALAMSLWWMDNTHSSIFIQKMVKFVQNNVALVLFMSLAHQSILQHYPFH